MTLAPLHWKLYSFVCLRFGLDCQCRSRQHCDSLTEDCQLSGSCCCVRLLATLCPRLQLFGWILKPYIATVALTLLPSTRGGSISVQLGPLFKL